MKHCATLFEIHKHGLGEARFITYRIYLPAIIKVISHPQHSFWIVLSATSRALAPSTRNQTVCPREPNMIRTNVCETFHDHYE